MDAFPLLPKLKKAGCPLEPPPSTKRAEEGPSFPRRNREVPVLEGGKGENQSSIWAVKGCEKTSHLGKYYIINTYNHMYILIYIPREA